jgi:deoxyribodipyrimidine photo-lyase
LRFGCIHPRTILDRIGMGQGADIVRSELAWREFYADVLWHRPESARQPLQAFGDHLRWDTGEQARDRFRAWATGRTGFPLVDAGMRQLLAEGWMHNRVRMVVASFLVKDLHIDWRLGARWFMWHLVDGDLASNQHNWQWVAGTGTDAAPFHRVFNPSVQQERFDPDGSYVRRYLKELSTSPWAGPGDGSLPLDNPYPEPVVDHTRERREALARFDDARRLAAVTQGP